MSDFLVIGFIVGFLLGVVLQRGSFCMYNGFANMVITKDYRVIKAILWAFLFTMIGFHLIHDLNIVKLTPKPFFYVGNPLGSFLFAIGMVLAGACIMGTPMKAASGRMGYWITLLGMGIGGWLVIFGPLTTFRTEVLQNANKVTIDGGLTPTIDNVLRINHWIVVFVFAVIIIAFLFRLYQLNPKISGDSSSLFKKIFTNLWSPLAIGISLAVVEVIAFSSGKSPSGLGGFIKGYAMYVKLVLSGQVTWGWPITEITGILTGVFVSSLISKEFRIVWPKLVDVPRLFFGGFLMGCGAVIAAGGCNMAHILSHLTQFSIGSFVSTVVIVGTTVIIVNIMFLKKISNNH